MEEDYKVVGVEPLQDKVLLKPLELGDHRVGAILTMANESDCKLARVVSVGPGCANLMGTFVKTTLEPGQVVVLPKIGAQRVEVNSEEYWIIAEKEIVGKALVGDKNHMSL